MLHFRCWNGKNNIHNISNICWTKCLKSLLSVSVSSCDFWSRKLQLLAWVWHLHAPCTPRGQCQKQVLIPQMRCQILSKYMLARFIEELWSLVSPKLSKASCSSNFWTSNTCAIWHAWSQMRSKILIFQHFADVSPFPIYEIMILFGLISIWLLPARVQLCFCFNFC